VVPSASSSVNTTSLSLMVDGLTSKPGLAKNRTEIYLFRFNAKTSIARPFSGPAKIAAAFFNLNELDDSRLVKNASSPKLPVTNSRTTSPAVKSPSNGYL